MATILSSLRELKAYKEKVFVDTYLANLEFISGHNHNNICNILNTKTVPTLKPLRTAIVNKTFKIAPELKANYKPSDRKNDIIKDIIYLGPYSFLAKENDQPSAVASPAPQPDQPSAVASPAPQPDQPSAVASPAPQPDQQEEPEVIEVLDVQDKPAQQPNWSDVTEYLKTNDTWGAETLSVTNNSTQPSITSKTASSGMKCSDTNNNELLNKRVKILEHEVTSLKRQLTQSEEENNNIKDRLKLLEEWTNVMIVKGLDLGDILASNTKSKQQTMQTDATSTTSTKTSQPTIVTQSKESSAKPNTGTQQPPPVLVQITDNKGPLPEKHPRTNKAELYIANVSKVYTCELMQSYINSSTDANLDLADIILLKTSNEGKAFKVLVPETKKGEVLSIWNSGIKAELFRRKPSPASGNSGSNKTFHKPGPHAHNNRGNKQWKHNNGQRWQAPRQNSPRYQGGPPQTNKRRPHHNFQKKNYHHHNNQYSQPEGYPYEAYEQYNDSHQYDQHFPPLRNNRNYQHHQNQCDNGQYQPNVYNWLPEKHENRHYEPYPDDRYYQNTHRY